MSNYESLNQPVRLDMQEWPDDTKPLVSISCITYNHAKFIKECLDGFLIQMTKFPVEILIHDDASTDGTDNIIRDYAERFPKLITPIIQVENQHSKGVRVSTTYNWPRAKGKYVALCEGDDYWNDSLKLQKQIDILEARDDVSMVFHAVDFIDENGLIGPDTITIVPKNYESLTDMATKGNYVHTPSVVYRNIIPCWPIEFNRTPIGDYCLYNLLLEIGNAHFINEKMGVYRHGTGTWSSQSQAHKIAGTITAFLCLHTYFSNKNKHETSEIYCARIKEFLKENIELISVSDIEKWASIGVKSKELIYRFLLELSASRNIKAENMSKFNSIKIKISSLKKLYLKP